ncbi:MAG: cytidine deaminase [Bacteroidia bacterium]|nr:cytidine deaminase [Bacteroidia bacterium]
MKTTEITTIVYEYNSVDELNAQDRNLIEKARQATKSSYAPYSGFQVGAAVLLANGEIICGSNQENAAFPSGLCAERVSVFAANAGFPDVPVIAVAVASFSGNEFTPMPVPPCGSCRQVMLETQERFKYPIRIILSGKDRIWIVEGIDKLLPLSFTSDCMKKS